jgi:hypothetical protein
VAPKLRESELCEKCEKDNVEENKRQLKEDLESYYNSML